MITLRTSALQYSFDEKGLVQEFIDLSTGICHAVPGSYAFYLLSGPEDTVTLPDAVSACGNLITVRFSDPAVAFTLAYLERETDIRFTILEQKPADAPFDRFVFAAVQTDDTDGKSPFSATARSLCLKCNMLELPGRCEKVGSAAYSRLGAVGVSSALIGVPRDQLVAALDAAVEHISVDDIPMTPYGGQHGKDAPGSHDDYVIASRIDISSDDWLKPLKRLNVRQVDFHQGGMYRQADYLFLPELFPQGATDFRRKVTDVLHKNGMRAGLHTYSGMIDVRSRYVTPVPSEDLHALAVYTLAEDISEDADKLYIEGSSDPVATVQSPHARENVTCLMIDQEIIRFSAKGPNGELGKLDRGWLGTQKAAHAKGAPVRHLRNMYGYFQSEPGSALYYKLAKNQATTFNDGGFDMMYFDGLECIGSCCKDPDFGEDGNPSGLGWYYEALYVREVLRHCKRTPLVEYSTLHPQIWASRSRAGAFDLPYSGYKHFVDIHCRDNEQRAHRRLMTSQLGWLSVYPLAYNASSVYDNWMGKIEFDDDADYLGSKAIAFDSGLSYVFPTQEIFDKSPAMCRIGDKLGLYSRLRGEHIFSESLREKLKAFNTGFRLIKTADGYAFERIERLLARPYSFRDGENACTVVNPFGAQKPVIRILGECTEDPAGESVQIADFDRNAPACTQKLLYEYPQGQPLNIAGKEALGIWVMGNGKDEYMNVRLEGMHPWGMGFGDHVIHLDFTGWRYFSLCESDNSDYGMIQFRNDIYHVDEHEFLYQRYRESYRYDGIARVRILFTGSGEDVRLGELTAKPFCASPILNPSVRVGDSVLTFQCELKPGHYAEYDPETGDAFVYDYLGNAEKIETCGAVSLAAGENTVTFNGEADGTRRIKVHFLVKGEILRD